MGCSTVDVGPAALMLCYAQLCFIKLSSITSLGAPPLLAATATPASPILIIIFDCFRVRLPLEPRRFQPVPLPLLSRPRPSRWRPIVTLHRTIQFVSRSQLSPERKQSLPTSPHVPGGKWHSERRKTDLPCLVDDKSLCLHVVFAVFTIDTSTPMLTQQQRRATCRFALPSLGQGRQAGSWRSRMRETGHPLISASG